jgi:hypothetical protein
LRGVRRREADISLAVKALEWTKVCANAASI